ncbi:hypothetical protein M0R45_016063 [Rubus argutus]|uniref:MHC class I antigen n=1 Tax=Rubus argutus TaxID=59490 RepID=A0AAW1XSL4_RUBAR
MAGLGVATPRSSWEFGPRFCDQKLTQAGLGARDAEAATSWLRTTRITAVQWAEEEQRWWRCGLGMAD